MLPIQTIFIPSRPAEILSIVVVYKIRTLGINQNYREKNGRITLNIDVSPQLKAGQKFHYILYSRFPFPKTLGETPILKEKLPNTAVSYNENALC